MSKRDEDIRFACDAMCGGLARWLRAIGYDAAWSPGVEDAELVRLAKDEGRILLSSDGGLFERRAITGGEVKALLLPRGMRRLQQLEFVVRELNLQVREPRCMTCGGPLVPVRREEVASEVPAKSLVFADSFYRCRRCRKVFWEGSHWRRIKAVRQAAAKLASHSSEGRGR